MAAAARPDSAPRTGDDTRRHEAMAAAALIGANFHPSLVNDMEIFYD